MKAYRRIFSLLLALALVLSLLPGELAAPLAIKASAATTISNAAQFFELISASPGGSFIQNGDIVITEGQKTKELLLTGDYDGNGYTIIVKHNDYKASSATSLAAIGGVFGEVRGTVKNLNVIVDLNVTSTRPGMASDAVLRLGGIAGKLTGTIQNCSVSGKLRLTQSFGDYEVTQSGQSFTTLYMAGTVGGIAGHCDGGTIEGCYVNVETGYVTDTANYKTIFNHLVYPYTYQNMHHYIAEAGGVAGRVTNGAITNCLVENSLITAAETVCNDTTFSFVGSVLGRELSSSSLSIQNNVVRGTKMYANYSSGRGYGYAGALAGWIDTLDKTTGKTAAAVGNNYLDCYVGAAAFGRTKSAVNFNWSTTGSYQKIDKDGWHNADDQWVMNGLTPVATPDRLDDSGMSKWVNDVVDANGAYLTTTNNTPASILKWRATEAPKLNTSSITQGAPNGTITLTSPEKIVPVNGDTKWDGGNIRYEMTFSEQTGTTLGTLPNSGITATVSGSTLSITDSNLALGGGLEYKKDGEDTDYTSYTGSIALGMSGTDYVPATYLVRAVDTKTDPTYKPSADVTIKVEADGTRKITGNTVDETPPGLTTAQRTVKYGDGQSAYHTHSSSGSNDLVITIVPKVAPNSVITIKTWMNVVTGSDTPSSLLFPRIAADTITLGDVTAPPTISPGKGESLASGITISGAGTINWTVTTTGGTSPGTTSGTGANVPPQLDGDWETLTVTATAKDGVKAESAPTTVPYSYMQKPPAAAPSISVGGNSLADQYYNPGERIRITHTEQGDGDIYYTTDGSVPTTGSVLYSSEYILPSDRNYVTISAVLVRYNYPDSLVATETIKIKTTHGSPLFSVENNSYIPSGQPLSMLVPENDLPLVLRPAFYMKQGDGMQYTYEDIKNAPDNYYGVLEVYGGYSNGVAFTQYSDYANDIPYVTYKFGDGSEKTYTPSTPEIRHYRADTDTGGWTLNKTEQPVLRAIPLTGTAGTTIEVNAKLSARNTVSYTDGAYLTKSMQYTFYPAVATPKAAPATSESNITTLSPGATVSLSCATAPASGRDVFLFYSLTGTPSVSYDSATGEFTANARTFLYDAKQGIEVRGEANSYFNIYAGAVRSDMSPSEIGIFTYQITGLSSVENPTATPTTSASNVATIENGSRVVLVSATSGARIFYSTDGVPEVSYDSQTKVYTPAAGTKDYSGVKETGIQASGAPGGVFTIYAVAMKDGMSDSEVVTLTYKIAELPLVQAPVATPKTTDDNVLTVSLDSRVSLSSATAGAKIFYSKTGLPAVTCDSASKDYIKASGTLEYDSTNGITVDGTPGAFFAINAIAVLDGMTNSNTASFTYKIADLPVASAPTATPKTADGSPITMQSGSVVTLQTATSGGMIFYSTTGVPVVNKTGSAYSAGAGTQLFDKSITVSGSAGEFFVIRAVTVKDGYQDSEIATFTYQLPAAVQAVYATPGEGTVVKNTEVTLATTTTGATIFYETSTRESDLDDPVPNESQVYTKPIKIEAKTWISAVAVKDGVESIITEYEYKVASTVGAPEPSIPSGSVVAKGTKLILASSTGGASVTYTKDGSDPTDEKNTKRMYGTDIAIDAEEGKSVSISAYAHKTGMTPSDVVSISYTVSKAENVMTANPAADSTVKPGDRITLSTSVSGAEIYYTTDGSEPTRDSEKGSTVTVDGAHGEAFIIRAIAATENTVTAPYIFSYKVVARTPAPSASIPNGAVILEGAAVTLTAPEGSIYYTTDGSEPEASGRLYTEPFELTGSTVLKAIAVAEGKAASQVAEYIYTMAGQVAAPTSSLPSGTIDVGSKITLSTTTEGAAIYYTTDGTTPTTDNLRDCFTYESPITISRPVSIRMFAIKQGMNASVANTVTYTVAYPSEEEAEADTLQIQWSTDKLFLFDQFVDSGEGPLFEDIVLRDSQTLTVVSAAGDALPENVQLVVVRERSPSAEDEDAVTRALDMGLGALYNITLVGPGGEPVQPLTSNGVEVGVPIPEGYEDTIVLICRINENGTVTAFPTRRSAGMLYAVVDHFSKYAVAVPALPQTKSSAFKLWYICLAAALILGGGALTVHIVRKRKKAREDHVSS